MQGQGSSEGRLPDTISFNHNPTPSDANMDQPISQNNNILNSARNLVPEYVVTSTTSTGNTYLNSASQVQNLRGWNLVESSTSDQQNYIAHNEQKLEDGHANVLPLTGVNLNQNSSGAPYSPLFMQSANNSPFHQDLNMGVEVGETSGSNCQVMDSSVLENMRATSSGSGRYFREEIYSSEGPRLSCKRKAIEGHVGQPSSSGSSSYSQLQDSNDWHNVPGWYNVNSYGSSASTSPENNFHTSPQGQLNARLGLNGDGNTFEIPLPLNLAPHLESTRRTRRVRIIPSPSPLPSPQQNPLPDVLPNGSDSGDSNNSLHPQSSRFVPHNNVLHTRSRQSTRWSRGSSSRAGYSLSFEERTNRPSEEPDLNSSLRNVSGSPIFLPTNETRDSAQVPTGWGLTGGSTSRNLGVGGKISRNFNPLPVPDGVPRRNPPRHSQRLSEYVQRSPQPPPPVSESEGQNSNSPLQQSASSSQAMVLPSSGAGNREDRLSRLRFALLLERQLNSATVPLRSTAGGAEGRSRLASEIQNVLDLMRRGEGLRLEDVVILDPSVLFRMADIHDRHRDMRLDIDNMSYEELLALEERIGNVSTGLSEETILNCMKQRKFFSIAMGAQTEVEPCCICREEYNDGEDVGTVECGHEFHSGCIKQWLMLKNLCPICKTTALAKSEDQK